MVRSDEQPGGGFRPEGDRVLGPVGVDVRGFGKFHRFGVHAARQGKQGAEHAGIGRATIDKTLTQGGDDRRDVGEQLAGLAGGARRRIFEKQRQVVRQLVRRHG